MGNRRTRAAKKYRAQRRKAIPQWADLTKIRGFYKKARKRTKETGEPHSVDHIVPLRHPYVCGLHCEDNLAVTHRMENCKKSNRHWPGMPDHQEPLPTEFPSEVQLVLSLSMSKQPVSTQGVSETESRSIHPNPNMPGLRREEV